MTGDPPGGRVLVADADAVGCGLLADILTGAGYAVEPAAGPAVAATDLFDAAVVDAVAPGAGAAALAVVRAADPLLPVLLLVPQGEVDRAAAALGLGPQHFVAKPARRDAVVAAVAAAVAAGRLARRAARVRAVPGFDALLGSAPNLLAALDLGRRAAVTTHPVCILGETGTGKSILAGAIHAASPRAGVAMVDEVLAGMSPDQQRDALFGHAVGAFTGAAHARTGLLHDANGSTLFLDEVADLAPEVQVSLLRFLDKGTYRPLGSNRDAPSNVRLVVATNADLPALVAEGRFRRDLFERFGPFQITLPPLRDRPADIPELVTHYAGLARPRGGPATVVTPEALARLCADPWPGNVRQLRLTVEAAVAVADGGPVRPDHCLLRSTSPPAPPTDDYELPVADFVDAARRRYFGRLAGECRTVKELADRAGLHPTNARLALKQYGLTPPAG